MLGMSSKTAAAPLTIIVALCVFMSVFMTSKHGVYAVHPDYQTPQRVQQIADAAPEKFLPHDFRVFYYAGRMAASAEFDAFYDSGQLSNNPFLDDFRPLEKNERRFSTFAYLPLYLPFLLPFGAIASVRLSQILFMALGAWLCFKQLLPLLTQSPSQRFNITQILKCIFLFMSAPFLTNFLYSQNTLYNAAIILCAWHLCEKKPLAAGAILSLLMYKYTFGLYFLFFIFMCGGRKMQIGWLCGFALQIALTLALFGWSIWASFLTHIPTTTHRLLQTLNLGNSKPLEIQVLCALVLAVALKRCISRREALCLMLAAMPIIFPYLLPYDYFLMLLAGILLPQIGNKKTAWIYMVLAAIVCTTVNPRETYTLIYCLMPFALFLSVVFRHHIERALEAGARGCRQIGCARRKTLVIAST